MVGTIGRLGSALLGAAALIIALVWSQRVVFAADITVTTCTNTGLQAAIASASPGDRIIFNCATPLIPITTTLTVDKSLAFDGTNLNPSGPIILDGGGATRIMNLSSNVALTLTTITLQRGNAGGGDGGAVLGDGTTTAWLSNTRVLSNTAWIGGGLRVGAATVISSSFLNNTAGFNGGGLVANSAATITGAQFVSNTASNLGGGLVAVGAATISGAQFMSNTASNLGGGLVAVGAATISGAQFVSNTAQTGGGLLANSAATITGTQFMSNTAFNEGGGLYANSAATITGTQFVSNTAGFNGGGLFANSAATISGAQFMSNTAQTGGGLYANSAATVTASSFVSNTARTGTGGGLVAVGAATITGAQFVSNTAQTGGGLYAISAATISGAQFVSNTANSTGGGLYANGAATITGAQFVSNTAQTGGGLYANGAATISGTQFVSNTANSTGGGLFAGGAATVTASSFLSNTAGTGGGLSAFHAATVTASSFVSNTARTGTGGGLYTNGAATVSGTQFLSNAAGYDGGGLFAGSAATVTASSFLSNTAGWSGGGLYAGATATATASSFLSNTAGWSGGGLYANGPATVTGSSFVSNTARLFQGGGFYAVGAATVTGSSFLSNTAGQWGGGLYAGAAATVTASSFLSNTARTGAGGGLYANGAATISGTQFVSNTAQGDGGGVFAFTTAIILSSTFVSNTGGVGGGLQVGSTATISATQFLSNAARIEGGGARLVGPATVTASSFGGNTARHGGALLAFGALTMTNSTLSANTALTSGGAISLAANSPVSVTLRYVTVISNTAPDAAIAAASAQAGAAHGVVLQQGATGANCLRVTFPGATGLVATDTSCGNASATSAASIALGPLANNGGPTLPDSQPTLTHLPAPTSVLVAGVACLSGVPTDQRGFARPPFVGGPCDIGAVQTVPTITLTSLTPNTAPAGSPATVVTVTGSGFLTVTQALVNGLVAPTTVVSTTQLSVTIDAADLAAAGVLTVSAQYGADPATRSNSLPFTVTLNGQTITFPNPGTQSPTSLPSGIPVTATATSGLPVTLTSQTAGVCAVSGFTVTLLSPGLCTLVANQGGNSVFAPASPVTQTFTINQLTQTVAFPNPGAQNPASLPSTIPVTATATSGLPVTLTSQTAGVCAVSGFTVTLLSPGLCTLVANQGGNSVFAPASPVTQTFTINQLTQTVAFPNPGTQNPASLPSTIPVTATATSGLPVTLTSQTAGVCTVSSFTVTLLSPGLCTLVANQGGNTFYAPASPVTQSFTVNAPPTGPTPATNNPTWVGLYFSNRPFGP